MILIANLVPPAPESSAAPDVLCLKRWQEFGEDSFALKRGGWVSVVEASVVYGDDFVGRFEHFGVYEAGDTICEKTIVIDWFEGGFGDFEHDTPVWTLLRTRV